MTHSRVVVQLGAITNACFVVMPFASMFEREYGRVIRPAVEGVGLQCVRGDEIYGEQSIVQDIWKSLRHARVVVAELSGRNPNVMYEVGLAHAIGKPIILITRNQDDVPFDLKSLRYLYYDTENPDWGADLRDALSQALRRVLEEPNLAAHLHGVEVETQLPTPPAHEILRPSPELALVSLSGVWRAGWLSIRHERLHQCTLVIPEEHGPEFTASMTVAYQRDDLQTIVEETLRGTLQKRSLSLAGVSYTYVQRGRSAGYSLDTFELTLSDDGSGLDGTVTLKYGTRKVSFVRAKA